MRLNASLLLHLHNHVANIPQLEGEITLFHPCKIGKAKNKYFEYHFKEAMYAGEIVYYDLAGLIPPLVWTAKNIFST